MISIEELNNLKTEYTEEEVIDELRKYFSEIPDITDEQIEKRVDKGKQLFFLMQLFFTMVATAELANEIQDIDYYISMISRRYSDIANETMDYIDMASMSIVNTTFMNMDDDYTLSNDRAFQIAENEACTIENYKDFQSAVKNGAKYKTWISERDNKVRKTHKNVDDGKTIPINDYFHVGNSLMLYPHDAVNGTPNEIINCRCHVEYVN